MRRTRIVAILAVVMLCPQPIIAASGKGKDPLVLTASSPWRMDYADDHCRLGRLFGSGDREVIFTLDRFGPGDSFSLMVAGEPLKGARAEATAFRFGPEGAVSEYPPIEAELVGKPALIQTSMVLRPTGPTSVTTAPASGSELYVAAENKGDANVFEQVLTPAQEAAITWLQVEERRDRPVRMALGPMNKPMAAMRKCTDELMTHWGIDVEAHRHLTRTASPEGNPGNWIGPGAYPTGLLATGSQGIVNFRLIVGPDGRVAECHVQTSSRPKGFDDAVCAAMVRRGRFQPALDAAGKPIKSFWRNRVVFRIP